MLKWYNHLYVGDNAKKNVNKYKKQLEKGKVVTGVYLITLSSNDADQLDIISNYYFLQNAVYKRCPMIVGIADSYEEARQLLLCMVEETISHTGKANIKEYLMQR